MDGHSTPIIAGIFMGFGLIPVFMTKILFITSTRIGDAVLSSGLYQYLVDHYPDCAITVGCGPLAAPLFRGAPGLERVIVMAKRKGGGHWINLWRETVGSAWDLVIDLRGSGTSWFLRAKSRVVKRKAASALLEDGTPAHKVIEASRVLKLTSPAAPLLWLDERAKETADLVMPKDGPVLAISPAASAPFKEWPQHRFSQLAQSLTHDGALKNAKVVVLGGPGDEAAAELAVRGLEPSQVVNLTGKLGILETAACLAHAHLFVGNDSGLMHLAAAAGIPTLGLFGPTDERLYGPWGAKTAIVRAGGSADEEDRKTLRFSEASLMGDLSVAQVHQAAQTLIEKAPSI